MFVTSELRRQIRPIITATILGAVLVSSAVDADPMRPPGYGAVSESATAVKIVKAYQVSQILHGETRKVALINGQWATIGDRVEGAKVIAITKDAVTLNVAGKKQQIAVHKASGMKIVREADK